MAYATLLFIHSWNRWIVLGLMIGLLVTAFRGWGGQIELGSLAKLSIFTIVAIDLQFLLGVLLYFLSPYVQSFMGDPGGSMANSVVRFWGVEHALGMLVAVILAHVGRMAIKKADSPKKAHRRAAIYFGIALLLMLGTIPWPAMPYGRALFRI